MGPPFQAECMCAIVSCLQSAERTWQTGASMYVEIEGRRRILSADLTHRALSLGRVRRKRHEEGATGHTQAEGEQDLGALRRLCPGACPRVHPRPARRRSHRVLRKNEVSPTRRLRPTLQITNVLDALPKKQQAEARTLRGAIPYAETQAACETLRTQFTTRYHKVPPPSGAAGRDSLMLPRDRTPLHQQ